MTDEIGAITARISEIQQRITALSPPPMPAAAPGPAFEQTLAAVQTPPAPPPGGEGTRLPRTSSVAAPPASLGPLPVSPSDAGVIPLAPISQSASGAGGYDGLIEKYAAQNSLPPSLVKAVIHTESDGNPHCVSGAGAIGLMQLMPENVKEAGLTDPFDPEQNIAAGTKQLAGLLSLYHGDLDLALAGYNAGPGNVRKYGGVPPFTETRHYIQRVRAAMEK